MVFVLPLLAVLTGGFGGQALMRHGGWQILLALVLALAALGYWMLLAGRAATGFDGIGYAIWLFLAILPALLGLLIGGLVGHLRRRRALKPPRATTPEAR